jgi:hypothetical protein
VRRTIIILITFIGGLYYFLNFVLPQETPLVPFLTPDIKFSDAIEEIGRVTLVIGVFAIFLGVINLSRLHLGRISRRRPGWYNSVALLTAFAAMFTFQLLKTYAPSEWGDKFQSLLFDHMYAPINSTIMSLLAFYMASAAYRAFRIKSGEAAVMMFIALIVMLGQIPIGQLLTSGLKGAEGTNPWYSYLRLEVVREWFMGVWNSAAQRGILFGMVIGAFALTLRIWLSLERGSFFDREL